MSKTNNTPALPKGVLKADLVRPKWDQTNAAMQTAKGKDGCEWSKHEYKLWYTERFGWVIPTLLISKSRNGTSDRYYGITVGDGSTYGDRKKGQQVRIGCGPHVLTQCTVYIKSKRQSKLQFLIDLYNDGQVSANDTRDNISTKRARTAARRQHYSW